METNPLIGLLLLTLAGVGGGSFLVPLAKVKQWPWEVYWLAMGVVAWLFVPMLATWLTVPNLIEVLAQSPTRSLVLTLLFGVMWGVGAVTFGLCVRYLGISLGMTIVVGFGAAFGTLIPPLVDGQFGQLFATFFGWAILSGVLLCVVGITLCGYAGVCKGNDLTEQQKQESVKDFDLAKGLVLATFSGVTSAGLSYAIHAGKPIAEVAFALGTSETYKNNPVFAIALAGGFAVNVVYCLSLIIRNRATLQYVQGPSILFLTNYVLAALAGILWYGQFFLYGMAITKMGEYSFAAWSILTALIMATSMVWGLVLKEWKGVSSRTLLLVWGGIVVLVLSVIVISAGSHLGTTN